MCVCVCICAMESPHIFWAKVFPQLCLSLSLLSLALPLSCFLNPISTPIMLSHSLLSLNPPSPNTHFSVYRVCPLFQHFTVISYIFLPFKGPCFFVHMEQYFTHLPTPQMLFYTLYSPLQRTVLHHQWAIVVHMLISIVYSHPF